MDSYDEVHDVKNGRNVETPPELDLSVSSAIKFINNDPEEEDEDEEDFDGNEHQLMEDEIRVKPKLEKLDSMQLQKSKKSFRKLNIDSIDNNNNLSDTSSDSGKSEDEQNLPFLKTDSDKSMNPPQKFEFNPKQYENLDVPGDLKEVMQYISRYTPQTVEIDYKLQVFVPEFIPAVGDIDAFLKVVTPKPLQSLDKTHLNIINHLGLEVLDEPIGEQSEEALLQIKLRSIFAKPLAAPSALVKSPKDIDKWIQEIQSLHASRIHDNLMQQQQTQINIDNLMTEWEDDIEKKLEVCYPSANLNCSLSDYVKIICNLFDIPIENTDNHFDYIRALNVLFNLFVAVREEK